MLKITAFKQTIRKFLIIVAAHVEGLSLFETLFLCQCPFETSEDLLKIDTHKIFCMQKLVQIFKCTK
jgi:hypothetical protein